MKECPWATRPKGVGGDEGVVEGGRREGMAAAASGGNAECEVAPRGGDVAAPGSATQSGEDPKE